MAFEDTVLTMLQSIQEQGVQLNHRVGQIEIRLEKLDGRMDRLESGMDRLEGRMDKLEGRMDKLEVRMDKLEGRMDKLEDRVGRLERRVDENAEDARRRFDFLTDAVTRQNTEIVRLRQEEQQRGARFDNFVLTTGESFRAFTARLDRIEAHVGLG